MNRHCSCPRSDAVQCAHARDLGGYACACDCHLYLGEHRRIDQPGAGAGTSLFGFPVVVDASVPPDTIRIVSAGVVDEFGIAAP